MASKEFHECGCMTQGDQEFLCTRHRAADQLGLQHWRWILGLEQPMGKGWLSVKIRLYGAAPSAEHCAYVRGFLELAEKAFREDTPDA